MRGFLEVNISSVRKHQIVRTAQVFVERKHNKEKRKKALQGGPLLVVNGVINPINGLRNWFSWAYFTPIR